MDEQQEYLSKTLEQNILQITAVLKEVHEVKKDYKEILKIQQQEVKIVKKGFFSRLFNR